MAKRRGPRGFISLSFSYWKRQSRLDNRIRLIIRETDDPDRCILACEIRLAEAGTEKIFPDSNLKAVGNLTPAGLQIIRRLQRASGIAYFQVLGSEMILYKDNLRNWYGTDTNDVIYSVVESFEYVLVRLGARLAVLYRPYRPALALAVEEEADFRQLQLPLDLVHLELESEDPTTDEGPTAQAA
ncbi:MAG TPA: hypothetical protein VLI05_05770 [Candidatus Saccharimonadia bacterium]|nr:hypothetical protein [Candidatus Saccharimonadia bacterium]